MSQTIHIQKQLLGYKPLSMVDHANLGLFEEFLSETKKPFDRANYDPGHITTAGFVVNKERTHCVLMHHKKLDKWIQPGGHVDDYTLLPEDNALKEVIEETGLTSVKKLNEIHTISVFVYPENKNEPEHMHYSLCYLFEADLAEKPIQNEESNGVRWFTLKDAYELGDDAVKRMIERV